MARGRVNWLSAPVRLITVKPQSWRTHGRRCDCLGPWLELFLFARFRVPWRFTGRCRRCLSVGKTRRRRCPPRFLGFYCRRGFMFGPLPRVLVVRRTFRRVGRGRLARVGRTFLLLRQPVLFIVLRFIRRLLLMFFLKSQTLDHRRLLLIRGLISSNVPGVLLRFKFRWEPWWVARLRPLSFLETPRRLFRRVEFC